MEDSYDRGMRTRREVLGIDHVERATAASTGIDADFQRWLTETAWDGVWSRPGLDRRTRSLVTIAVLAALGRDELDLHLRAAANTGASPEEIAEVMFHVGVYAGIPAGHSGMRRLKAIAGGEDEG
jgi:4-carboxymuconolactone decarboxylase